MGNIVGNVFGVVASKDQATALTESIKTGNEAKFYLSKNNTTNTGATCNAAGNKQDSIALTINGNVLRGMSAAEQEKLDQFLSVNPATVYKFKGTVATYADLLKVTSVKAGDVYNVTDPTSQGYPKETNFAATKDGTGATTNIWDSLGGIGVKVSTADNITLTTYTTQISHQKLTMKPYAGATRNNTVVDAIEIAAAKPLIISTRTPDGEATPTFGLDLGNGLLVDGDNKLTVGMEKIVMGEYLTAQTMTQMINGTSVTFQTLPISVNETHLNNHISNMALLKSAVSDSASSGIVVLDKGYLTIQVPSYTNQPDQADGILCITTGLAKKAANGLYISSKKLAEFVNRLVNLAISSALEAK